MSAKEFKTWMTKQGLRPVDVASLLDISQNTVYRFLRGEGNNRSTISMLRNFMHTYRATSKTVTN
jgi:predicted transcriptional regulator